MSPPRKHGAQLREQEAVPRGSRIGETDRLDIAADKTLVNRTSSSLAY